MSRVHHSLSLRLVALLGGAGLAFGGVPAAHAVPVCVLDESTIADCLPDEVLASAVAGQLGKDRTPTDVLTANDVSKTRELFVHGWQVEELYGKKIEHLDGIEVFQNLEGLMVDGNNIADISPVADLRKLENLFIGDNPIADVSMLANLPHLRNFEMSKTLVRDTRMIPANIVLMDGPNGGRKVVPFTREGSLAEHAIALHAGAGYKGSAFGATYTRSIEGVTRDFTYSFASGYGEGTTLFHSGDPLDSRPYWAQPLRGLSEDTSRGDVLTSDYGELKRRAERIVTEAGDIRHSVELTNPTSETISTRAYETINLQFNEHNEPLTVT